MQLLLPLLLLGALAWMIWYLGGGSFGRAQTQAWIDHLRAMPRLYVFLDRNHGKFRAAMHYVEFGGLFLALYWLQDAAIGGGEFAFRGLPSAIIAVACAVAALLDEMHQLKSGTRQFRRVDFLHSCCGIAIAMALVFLQSVAREIE